MARFLIIVISILLTSYLYLCWQLAFRPGIDPFMQWFSAVLLLVPFFLILWLPLVHWRRAGRESEVSRVLQVGSYLSLAFGSFLFLLTVVKQILTIAIPLLAGPWGTGTVVAGSIVCMAVGIWEARWRSPRIETIEIPIPDLPPAFDGFRIAQVSDLHIDPTTGHLFVEHVVAAVNATKPDAIVLTGDIVDGTVALLRDRFAPLGKLEAPAGRFYITGNHEYYWGATSWIEESRRIGLTALLNEHRVIERDGQKLVMAGITDYQPDLPRSVQGAPLGAPRILLSHHPGRAIDAAKLSFNLQLSGHTHGGQFFPWTLVVNWVHAFPRGLHLYQGLWVYVNRGTGSWGPPVRMGSRAEITLLTLRPLGAPQPTGEA